ncbi:MAG: single-stranded DNA-binding protein [Chloroflexi bacterium]|nr:single-stranded DNA-binding protein [Chloroflexota bacterium]MCY3588064.1 single-stranded DNA-binding protein [Chloroflexota bacterium]MCY3686947.1 single-stranded DNA-binding protein [Chloroflexota bacterium]MDE2709032.1 single-stranded DNA-binding protein [Chloroflexota bacterium]MYF80720.1 single-stranded DNA-binding protein [Chloroflexota bacterium]
MSRTINRVELLGRVGADPELRQTQGGTAVVQLRLATDRRNSDGESQTDWHTVVCWAKQAEAVAEYVRKGERIYVAGRMQQQSWETDGGERRSRTEVHAQEVIFLGSGSARGNGRNADSDGDQPF